MRHGMAIPKNATIRLSVLLIIGLVITSSSLFTKHLQLSENLNVITRTASENATSATTHRRGYDCSIYWLRVPKTASTSILNAFIGPLFSNEAGLFANIEHDSNNCIQGVGGCNSLWGMSGTQTPVKIPSDKGGNNTRMPNTVSIPVLPYGIAASVDHDEQKQHFEHAQNNSQRCFPTIIGGKTYPLLYCYEFDALSSSLNFGPHRHMKPGAMNAQNIFKVKRLAEMNSTRPTSEQMGNYISGPNPQAHVGLDPSLFGWLYPNNPLVFSAFRDPIERLLSSFHYGIIYAAGRPGEVKMCKQYKRLTTRKQNLTWPEMVAQARDRATVNNDTSLYQDQLRGYLVNCKNATDNVYVQFLDPNSKDVGVALENLDRYVIVGLQSDVEQTLQRWKNITLQSCVDHPKFQTMQREMANANASRHQNVFQGRRKMQVDASGTNHTAIVGGKGGRVKFVPDVDSFDQDLQQLIRRMTAGDEVIYRRVLEMYHGSQSHLGS